MEYNNEKTKKQKQNGNRITFQNNGYEKCVRFVGGVSQRILFAQIYV